MSLEESSERVSVAPVEEIISSRQPALARESVPAKPAFWLPVASLWWRELVRFYRQRSRVIGVLGSPLVFWLVVGSGFGESFRTSEGTQGYLEYFFPGIIVLTLLFTSIFCMMSVIEDRREGFLLSVLVSPISRAVIVLGKVLGGTTLAVLQSLLMVPLALLIGLPLGLGRLLLLITVLFLVSFALTALGFFIAWRLDSTHGFHALINLFMIPMWMLSGAVFPISGAQKWVAWLMRINPLTYSVRAVREIFYLETSTATAMAKSLGLSLTVTITFGLVTFLAALAVANRQEK